MNEKLEIDIIIISYAQTDELKEVTQNAISSLMASEDPELIQFNVIVVESEKSIAPYQYPNSKTVYPEVPFGYHRYLNIGIAMTSAPFICLCNNDLVFHENWATEILKPFFQFTDVFSACPFCTIHHPNEGFKQDDGIKIGYRIREELVGWCIFLRRDLLLKIGKLDENYIFWAADNDYANTLNVLRFPHILVTSSKVDHLESKTLNQQDSERKLDLTERQATYLKKKWHHRGGEDWVEL